MDALLVDINQAGLSRGLQFELFKPAPSEMAREFYAELPISLQVIGNYHDMGGFAADVGQLPRIVTLNDVTIEGGRDGNLSMVRHCAHLPLPGRGRDRCAAQGGVQERPGEEMKRLILLTGVAFLAACGGEEQGELRQELAAMTKDLRGKVDPLPQVRSYEPVPYKGENMVDPFVPGRIVVSQAAGEPAAVAASSRHDRPRSRSKLFRSRRSRWSARSPRPGHVRACARRNEPVPSQEGQLHGPELRRDHGDRTKGQINLKEVVQDAGGDWVERSTTVQMSEGKK